MGRPRTGQEHRVRQKPDRGGSAREPGQRSFAISTAHAAFIPDRAKPLQWESPSAEFLGDPPIGRRAIDRVR